MFRAGVFMWWITANTMWTIQRIWTVIERPLRTGRSNWILKSISVILNVCSNRFLLWNRTILFFGSARALSVTAVTNATHVSTAITPLPEIPAIPAIPAIPEVPVASVIESVSSSLEPTLASIGLGGWSPVGVLQNALEFLHISCDLPWWGAIVVSTICLRLVLTPLVIIAQRNAAKMHEAMPKMQAIQLKMTEARQMGNATETARYSQELVKLMSSEKVNPLKNMIVPLAQAPIFLSYFIGIRRMVNAPVESMQTGGFLWISDLTVPDPYYLLPLFTCSTLFLTIHLGVDGMNLNMANGHIIKYLLRGIPVVLFPFIMNFPSALVVYWSTSNLISLLQVCVLRIKLEVFIPIKFYRIHFLV